MSTRSMILFIVTFSFLLLTSAHKLCDVCLCGRDIYNNAEYNIANCTDKLKSNNINLLETIQDDTEVLILRDNNLPSLPANLFGSEKNFSNLKIIDMSSNNIEKVRGKTFHHVPNVELLILNHNSITFDVNTHPRMFSNLENLKELHLTDAFLDYESPNLASQLHDVFINSNMIKLEKLHLEQNEIGNFSDLRVFCNLKNLLDLHLGDNILTGLHFHIDCLPRLRFMDLEGNKIETLTREEFARLDALPDRNQSLMVDIHNNPFVCDCELNLFSWLQTTKVVVRDNSSIRCHDSNDNEKTILLKEFKCTKKKPMFDDADYSIRKFADVTILVILCGLIVLLFYLSSRYLINYYKHGGISSSKVHYVVIKNFDESRDTHVTHV